MLFLFVFSEEVGHTAEGLKQGEEFGVVIAQDLMQQVVAFEDEGLQSPIEFVVPQLYHQLSQFQDPLVLGHSQYQLGALTSFLLAPIRNHPLDVLGVEIEGELCRSRKMIPPRA